MSHEVKLTAQPLTRRELFAKLGTGFVALAFGSALGESAFAHAPVAVTILPQQSDLPFDARFTRLRERYFLNFLKLNPVTSSYLGGDAYSPILRNINARLRDYSPAALRAEAAFYRDVLTRLQAIDPQGLSSALQIDQQVMTSQLRFMLREIEVRRYHERALETYVIEAVNGVNYQLQQMTALEGDLLGSEAEWLLVVRRINKIPAYLVTAQVNLRTGRWRGNVPDRRMVQLDGIEGSQAAIQFFGTDLQKMAADYLGSRSFAPRILARLQRAGEAATGAYQSFVAFLNRAHNLNEQVNRYAIGVAEYEWKISNNFRVAQTAAALYDYGAAQVANFENQMFATAEQLAAANNLNLPFGSDDERRASTRQVLVFLNQDAPASDDQLFSWYREIGQQAVDYGREQQLFTIPDNYQLEVVETPPALQSGILAAYNPAPPFKAGAVGQFYVTPTGDDPAKLRESSRSFMTNIAVHEGFPGHDWHYKYMTANAAGISNIRWLTPGAVQDTSSMWSDSMAAEGWAHYAEQLVSETAPGRPYGFYTQKDYLYFLQAALFRAVRVRVDVGLHTEQLTFDEAVDYFTAHYSLYPQACAQSATDPAAAAVCALARREIYRYSKWPTQAVTYNLGKNAILELREAYQAKLGDQYSEQEFHERVMAQGTIAQGYYRDQFLSG